MDPSCNRKPRNYLRLVEIPIGIMDTDIFSTGRLNLGSDETAACEYIRSRIREAEEKKAVHFCMLFHQESYRMKGGRLYKELIKYLHSKGYDAERCIDAVKKVSQRESEGILRENPTLDSGVHQ